LPARGPGDCGAPRRTRCPLRQSPVGAHSEAWRNLLLLQEFAPLAAMIRGIPRKVQRELKKIFVGLNPCGSFPRQWTFLPRHQSSRDVGPRFSDWPVGPGQPVSRQPAVGGGRVKTHPGRCRR
jgi:hypothetical protein